MRFFLKWDSIFLFFIREDSCELSGGKKFFTDYDVDVDALDQLSPLAFLIIGIAKLIFAYFTIVLTIVLLRVSSVTKTKM